MKCPLCKRETKVSDSRKFTNGSVVTVIRTRVCTSPSCKHTFSTTERPDRSSYHEEISCLKTELAATKRELDRLLRVIKSIKRSIESDELSEEDEHE